MNEELKNPKFQELLPEENVHYVITDRTMAWFISPKKAMILFERNPRGGGWNEPKGQLFVTNKALIFESFDGKTIRRYTYGLLESINAEGPGWVSPNRYLNLTMIGGRKVMFWCYKHEDLSNFMQKKFASGEFDKLGDSEIINTCNRCERQWFMNPTELDEFEKGKVSFGPTGADALHVGLVMLHFGVAAGQRLSTEKTISSEAQATRYAGERARLEAKYICPDCSSTDITRNISKKGEKINKPKKKIVSRVRKSSGDDKLAKLKEIQSMYKDGLIDKEEFTKLKKEIIG